MCGVNFKILKVLFCVNVESCLSVYHSFSEVYFQILQKSTSSRFCYLLALIHVSRLIFIDSSTDLFLNTPATIGSITVHHSNAL